MREITRRISAAFAALLKPKKEREEGPTEAIQSPGQSHPTMRMDHGAHGSVQVGHAGGPVTIVNNFTQNLNAPERATPTRPRKIANDAQREVLRLMRSLPDQAVVKDFMHREFGTRMVIDLEEPQLFRVRRYVEKIHQNSEKPDDKESTRWKS